VELHFIVLVVGVLLGFWDVLLGRRRWQSNLESFRARRSTPGPSGG